MTKCLQCGANLNIYNNCDYCGYQDLKNIKQIKIEQSSDIRESLVVIDDNRIRITILFTGFTV